jgi:flagellar L-ring protein precursor FlgH
MKRFATVLACAVICAAVFAALAGCEQLNPRPPVDLASPIYAAPVATPAPVAANGSIYQAAQYRPLFEDYRARLVGDSITVQIVEKISATQKSTSSIDKSGKL